MKYCCSSKAWLSQCRILKPRFYPSGSHATSRVTSTFSQAPESGSGLALSRFVAKMDWFVSLGSDRLERLYEAPAAYIPPSELHSNLLRHLTERGASFLFNLRAVAQGHRLEEVTEALWDLVWAGIVTNDTLSPLRSLGKGSKGKGRRKASQTAGGRWSLVQSFIYDPAAPTERNHHWAQLFLRRYGIVLRDMCKEEPAPSLQSNLPNL